MKPSRSIRGSDVSQVSLYRKDFLRCEVNPLSRRGRAIQTIGLVILPLLSSIVLIVYSSISLNRSIGQYSVSKRLSKYVDVSVNTLSLLEALGVETSLASLEISTNKSLLFGLVEEATENVIKRAESMTAWPDDPDYASESKFHIKLNQFRETKKDKEKVIELYKVYKYLEMEAVFLNWTETYLLVNTDSSTWKVVNALNHLIRSYSNMVMEKMYNAMFFLVGRLNANEYAVYVKCTKLVIDHFNSSKIDSEIVRNMYIEGLSQNEATGFIEDYRRMIMGLNDVTPSLYNSVVSHKRYMLYKKGVMEIIARLATDIHDISNRKIQSFIGEITFYIMVIILLMTTLFPFVLMSAKRTIKSLLMYAVMMEKKSIELKREKRKIDTILNQMLPRAVAYRLKRGENVNAEEFEEATVFFSDIEDFGEISSVSAPMQIVGFLNEIYNFMDQQIGRYDVYKVETIGCVYMVVSGIPMRNGNRHACEIARLALDTIYATEHFVIAHLPGKKLQIRIGAHTGPVVAGVIGNKTPRYCLFGDTVNTASRMQSSSKARKIHVSQFTKEALDKTGGFCLAERGTVDIKGKGQMTTYWLASREGSLYDATISAGSEDEECGG